MTCDTSDGAAVLDSLVPAYSNHGTINNAVADGVKLDDAAAVFTNNGVFNNKAVGALNFNAAGATFANAGVFNSTAAGGLVFNADGTVTNTGIFNDIVANSFNANGYSVTFSNNVGGVFNAFGGTIDLGGGTFTNSGTLNLGGAGPVGNQTSITGDYVQTGTGVLRLRTNWGANTADNLSVSNNATLAGTIVVNHTNVTGGAHTRTVTILTANGALTNNGVTVANSAAVSNVLTAGANALTLTSTINFMGVGGTVSGNAAAMAQTVNTLFAGGATMPFASALLSAPTMVEYSRALQSLGPISDRSGMSSTLSTSSAFANQLLSCRIVGEGDAYAVLREGQCAWARMTGRRAETGSTSNGPGAQDSSMMISTGAQVSLGGPWRVGGAIAYEQPKTTSAFARSDTQRVHLGGVVKYNPGPWLFALALNGGWANSDNTRFVSIGGFNASATSSNESDYISGRFTTAYLMPLGSFYVKPQFDLAQTSISRAGYTESGTGGIALNVQGTSLSVWSYAPSLEVGMQTRLANDNIVRPYGKIGGTWQDKDQISTTASFTGFGGPSFTFVSAMDRAFLDLGAGLDVIAKDGSFLRFQLDGKYGENSTTHSGSAKFSLKF